MTTHRPAILSGALSVIVGALSVALVATASDQRFALVVTLCAMVPLALGLEVRDRGYPLVGLLSALVGVAGVGGALVLAISRLSLYRGVPELLPGLLGVTVVVLALGQLRSGSERTILAVGVGLLLLSPLLSITVHGTDTVGVLAAGLGTILVFDLAEQSINVGEQVGREPATAGIELVHAGSTFGVCVAAVAVTTFVVRADVTGLPLTVLAGLLAAGLTLAIALYN